MAKNSLPRILLAALILLVVLSLSCAPRQSLHKGDTIAVWDLDDLSPTEIERPYLGELLSGKIIETIKEGGSYSVIERERLMLALEELRLGTTALADDANRLRLGRLSGARFMVFGGYQIIGERMRLDLRLVEVGTARVWKAVKEIAQASDVAGWLAVAEKATESLLSVP